MYISAVILQNGQPYFLKINLKHVWNTWYGGDRYNSFFFFGGGELLMLPLVVFIV